MIAGHEGDRQARKDRGPAAASRYKQRSAAAQCRPCDARRAGSLSRLPSIGHCGIHVAIVQQQLPQSRMRSPPAAACVSALLLRASDRLFSRGRAIAAFIKAAATARGV